MNNHLSLKNINLTLAHKSILEHINFDLQAGEIGCLLGPSGCGKTSLLRIIAGLEDRASGEVLINQQHVQKNNFFIKPQHRKIGMVFQDYALFPHLNAEENITFGLDHLNSVQRKNKLEEMVALVKLDKYRLSYPHYLSGGQQQRVSLARALAQEPTLLLLDEPFSNLDAKLRTSLADEVKTIIKKLRMTALLVTHDQEEAFAFSDHIAVMNHGRIEQNTSTIALYHQPVNPFVAHFIGEGIVVPAEILNQVLLQTDRPYHDQVLIRPEAVFINNLSGTRVLIMKKIFRGPYSQVTVKFENGLQVYCNLSIEVELGQSISISFDQTKLVQF